MYVEIEYDTYVTWDMRNENTDVIERYQQWWVTRISCTACRVFGHIISKSNNNNNLNIDMRSIILAAYAALSSAFIPQPVHLRVPTLLSKSKHVLTGDVDTDAKYCADHFGECSLDEMERIRDCKSWKEIIASLYSSSNSPLVSSSAALHEERIAHVFSNTDGINNPRGLQEDITHKLLESDLTVQMGLLHDKLATEQMLEDSRAAFGINPKSATMNLPVMDGVVDEESSEALMICLTIAALAFLPQFM